jgi:hypothetical protein
MRHPQQGPKVYRCDAELLGLLDQLLMMWPQAVDAGLCLAGILQAAELVLLVQRQGGGRWRVDWAARLVFLAMCDSLQH